MKTFIVMKMKQNPKTKIVDITADVSSIINKPTTIINKQLKL